MLTSAQIRAARALLRWSAEDLARQSAIGVTTIRRAELTDQKTSMTKANDLAVRRALEGAGVEFIDENGGGQASGFVTVSGRKRPNSPPVILAKQTQLSVAVRAHLISASVLRDCRISS